MNYQSIKDDYPAYYNYNKRYLDYFHHNEKFRKNMSPIILFNEPRIKALAFSEKTIGKQFSSGKIRLSVEKSSKAGSGLFDKFFATKKILKHIFIMICWAFCCYQTIDIFKKYSSYPMDVNVIVEEMKLLQLPGITVCNNNILLRENLFEQFPDLNEKTNGSLKEIAEFSTKYMKNSSLSDILYLSPSQTEFVDEMECDSQFDPTDPNTDNKKKKCSDKEVIRSLQRNGVCFTYFHKMAKYGRGKDDSACKMMGTCVNNEVVFDTNEIARFELNFHPEEYTSNDLPISGRISIHDNSEIGDSLSNAYNLEPGYYYQFFIKVQSTSMLAKPYATNCMDYLQKNSLLFNSTPDYTTIPLSRKHCSLLCISKFTLRVCNCWPPELPYIKDNQLDANMTNVWCQWKFDMKGAQFSYGTCFDKLERLKCSVKCQPSCWTDHFEVTVQKLSFEYFGRKDWSSEDESQKKCCSVVSIRYWSTERTIHEYSPMFTILDMVCYVGGLVSMYTGLSLVALYDYMTILFYFTKKHI